MEKTTVESTIPVVLDLTEKAPIRVLHVDDEAGFLKAAKECLEMQGPYRVETAQSVEEAKEKMKKKTYDALVCDYKMPDKDGLEFLKELRKDGNNIPFIMFTGKGREEIAIAALNLGADRYLNKHGGPEAVYSELAHSICQVVEAKEGQKALRAQYEAFPVPTYTWRKIGKDFVLVDCNTAAVEITHGNVTNYLGEKASEMYRDRPKILEELSRCFTERTVIKREMPYEYMATGETKYLAVTYAFVPPNLVLVHTEDMTERKKTERLYRSMIELSPASIMTVDTKGVITSCNTAATGMLGYSEEEMVGKHFSKIGVIRVRDLPKFLKLFGHVLRGRGIKPLELTFHRKDGTSLLAEVRVGLLKEGGKTIGIQAVSRDITERKKAEHAVRESKRKFQGLFMDNPEAAVFVGPNFRILDVNSRFTELFGYSLNELKGKLLLDVIVPEEKREEAKRLDEDATKGRVYSLDTIRKRKDGSLAQVTVSAAPITIDDQLLGYVGLYKDISVLKHTQEELEEAKRHFQKLFDLMVDPVAVVDGKGKILDVSQRALEITGFKKEELVGKNFLRTKIATTKSKALMMKNLAKRMMGMHLTPYEVEILTKDGRKLPYELNAAKIAYKGQPADMVVFRDVAERRKMAEKLRVVGKLTRHDVRNKLSTITGNAYLAKKKLTDKPEVLDYLEDMESACRQTARILDFARTYEKLGVEELVYLSVEKVFDEAARLFSDFRGITVVTECNGLQVLADSLLRQVFYNLLDNSLKHGGELSRIRVFYDEEEGDQLRLIYEDDGVGVPLGEKVRIFEEGYGRDTGYGLYLIKRICEVYGWDVEETGKEGQGAQLTFIIPKNRKGEKENYRV